MKKQFIYEKKRVVVLLFLTITASLTWYVSKKNTINEAMHNLDLPDSGFSLDEAKINITNQTGQLMISILAEKAYEEPLNRVLNLDNIYIEYMTDNQNTWLLTAKSGQISEDKTNILLSGSVTLKNQSESNQYPNKVTANELSLQIQNSLVNSENLVRVYFKDGSLETKGIEMDLTKGNLILKSEVYGKFNP